MQVSEIGSSLGFEGAHRRAMTLSVSVQQQHNTRSAKRERTRCWCACILPRGARHALWRCRLLSYLQILTRKQLGVRAVRQHKRLQHAQVAQIRPADMQGVCWPCKGVDLPHQAPGGHPGTTPEGVSALGLMVGSTKARAAQQRGAGPGRLAIYSFNTCHTQR